MYNYRENFTRVFPIILVALFLCACAAKTFTESTYDTISTSNEAVHRTMTYMGKQYRKDNLDDSQKEKIISIYEKYRATSDAAAHALATYAETDDQDDREKLLSIISDVVEYRDKLITLVNVFLDNDGGSK